MISLLLVLLEENLKTHIYFLANNYLEGRFCGYNQIARDYIKFNLKRYGYEVLAQEFDVDGKIRIDSFYTNLNIPIKPLYFSASGYAKFNEISIVDGDTLDNMGLMHRAIEERNNGKKAIIFLLSKPIQRSYFKGDLNIVALQVPKEYKDSLKNKKIEVYLKISKEKVKGENIFAFKKGKSLTYIIIGAHYDHLRYGDISSLDSIYDVHNGADDNASGVAGVLELANYYKDKVVRDNIVFAFWDCEEIGTVGSEFYIQNSLFPLQNTKVYINFDMIGRLKDSALTVIGSKTANEFEEILKRNNEVGFNLKLSNSGFGSSDQNAFYNAKIPVLHFFTGVHKDYHRTTDDARYINFLGMRAILEYVIKVIEDISKIETLTFNEVKEERSFVRTGNRVRLGVIPDYSYDGNGVRVVGVSKGTPAERVGLKEGDIILKIGKYEIRNIYDLTYVLTKFKKGQKTKIEFLSDGKLVQKTLNF